MEEETRNTARVNAPADIRRRSVFLSWMTAAVFILTAIIAVSYVIVTLASGIHNRNEAGMLVFCAAVAILCIWISRKFILEGLETRRMQKRGRKA